VRAVLSAYFDQLNQQGGIYNRRLELRVLELPPTATAAMTKIEQWLAEEEVFALVGTMTPGLDAELAAVAQRAEVPLIGPLTLNPQTGFPINRQVFYLFSGLSDQAAALVNFAAQKLPTPRLALIYPDQPQTNELATTLEAHCSQTRVATLAKFSYPNNRFAPQSLVARLNQVDAILFAGASTEAMSLMQALGARAQLPDLLLLGALTTREIFTAPPIWQRKLHVAYPTLPPPPNQIGAAAGRAPLTISSPLQVAAYGAARVLVEGLKLTGRELSREKLITALEGLYEFDPGVTPPLTYGPNWRIGAPGAYVLTIDLQRQGFGAASDWIAPHQSHPNQNEKRGMQ
jgi:ABC-type branched-subunit amino acid transport system substrate-binding protein